MPEQHSVPWDFVLMLVALCVVFAPIWWDSRKQYQREDAEWAAREAQTAEWEAAQEVQEVEAVSVHTATTQVMDWPQLKPLERHQVPVKVTPYALDEVADDLIEPRVTLPVVSRKPVVAPQNGKRQFCLGQRVSDGSQVLFPIGHIFIARRTGSGKSNQVAILMGQAIEQRNIAVWYGSVAYMPVDEDGLDISPLIDRCARVAIDPDLNGLDVLQLLRDARQLISERQKQAIEQKVGVFSPVLIIGEEIKALQSTLGLLQKTKRDGCETVVEEASQLMEVILSSGRKFNVNLVVVSQDGQSQTVKLSQGTLTNVGVRLAHPSLDPASLRNLLPQGYDLKHHPLPKPTGLHQWYLIMDSGSGMSEITLIDVPKMDNKHIATFVEGIPPVPREQPRESRPVVAHLGADEGPLIEPQAVQLRIAQPPALVAQVTQAEREDRAQISIRQAQVLAWITAHPEANQTEVAMAVWGHKSGPYNQRAKKYMEMMRPYVPLVPMDRQDESDMPESESGLPDEES